MKLSLPLPLRYAIPVLLLLLAFLHGSRVYFQAIPAVESNVERSAVEQFRHTMTIVQGTLSNLVRRNDREGVQTVIATLGALSNIRSVYLLDEQNRVMVTTDRSGDDVRISGFIAQHAEPLERARSSLAGSIVLSQDRQTAFGYYPIQFNPEPGELRPSRSGILLAVDDLVARKYSARHAEEIQVFYEILVIAGLSGLLWVVFYLAVTRRTSALVNAARQFAAGRLGQRVVLLGNDELAELGSSFNQMAEDIEEEHRRLIESEQRIRTIVDNAAEGIISVDSDGNIDSFNPAAELMFGYSQAEMIGTGITRILANLRNPELNCIRCMAERGACAGSANSSCEINATQKSGKVFPVDVSVSASGSGDRRRFIFIVRDNTERQLANQRLERLANYDPLTRLPNRALFRDRLDQAIARSVRNDAKVALLFIDLDRFKSVNDGLGHEAGDQLLQSVAMRLQECVRRIDTVSRLGGDEFTLILEAINEMTDVVTVTGKVLRSLSAPFNIEGHEIYIGGSIGIALYPDDADDGNVLLKNADVAMYHAKSQGRNNYQFYTSAMNASSLERLNTESMLKHALERDEFVLHYQPRLDIKDGRIVGMEALLRWQHPEQGLVQPAEFIHLLEETGMILQVGEWVLRTAARQARQWADSGFPDLRLAVNLSARQCLDSGLEAMVMDALRESGFPAHRLELEITENLLVDNRDVTVTLLRNLRARGIEIAIDDFGTGYSSMNYLRKFPIDVIKIDRSFVSDIVDDSGNLAIVAAIISMGRALGMHVTAEGIDCVEQLELVRSLGCTEVQGYLFSRPVSAAEFTRLLSKESLFDVNGAASVQGIRVGN